MSRENYGLCTNHPEFVCLQTLETERMLSVEKLQTEKLKLKLEAETEFARLEVGRHKLWLIEDDS